MKVHKATDVCYFIAHEPSVHYGELESGQEIVTGQNTLTIYDNELEYIQRLQDFGVELSEDQQQKLDEQQEYESNDNDS